MLFRRTTPLLLTLLIATGSHAADNRPASLQMVPEDASFYVSLLRNHEQYEIFVNSKAFKKIAELPMAIMGVAQLKTEFQNDSDLAPLRDFLADEQNKPLIKLAQDAYRSEIFFYGDDGWATSMSLLNEINVEMQKVQREQLEALQQGNFDAQQGSSKAIADLFLKHQEKLQVPDFVVGFELSQPKRSGPALDRLETLLREALAGEPAIAERLKRAKIAGGEFLSLDLDGTLIPWDEVLADTDEAEREDLKRMSEVIKKQTMSINIGRLGSYFVISVGNDHRHLEALGKGKPLAGRKELAALEKHADKRLTSISYVSEALAQSTASLDNAIEQYQQMAEMFLAFAELEPSLRKKVSKDLEELGEDLKKYTPKPAAIASFAFLTDTGYEGYRYNWGSGFRLDGTQPLGILQHIGGKPVAFVAARGKSDPADYETSRKWIGKGFEYWERIGVPMLSADEQAIYSELKERLTPLVKRLDVTNQKLLLPALADGQGAVVINTKLKEKQWHPALPASERDLPLPEMAMVYGVSDAAKLKKGVATYFETIQEILDVLHAVMPTEIPQVKLPAPQSKELDSGTVYFYTLPKEAGIDKRIAPNAGLSDDTAVLSLLPRFTKNLLTATTPKLDGPLADSDRPLAAAAHVNFAGLVDIADPWIDYALDLYWMGNVSDEDGAVVLKGIKHQVHFVLDLLRCIDTIDTATYMEGKATVSHYSWTIKDLP